MNLPMPPVLIQLLRSRGAAAVVLAGLGLLLYLTILHLDGRAPVYQELAGPQMAASVPVPVSRLGGVFDSDPSLLAFDAAKQPSAFYTSHFGPAPAPPPPTTRMFGLTYLGFYSSAAANRRVMVQMDAGYLVIPVGERALSNLFVADATFKELVLTNTSGQTNLLLLNTKKAVEVPIK
jgi:hypothetical protein